MMGRVLALRAKLIILVVGLAAAPAAADVSLPRIFGDHMVLQQRAKVAVWGKANPGEKVTVTLGAEKVGTVADAEGRWQVKLQTPAAGGPFELKVQGENQVTFKDVLVGEVWICSGQSNMEWAVGGSQNPKEEAEAATFPQIRMIKVARTASEKPADDFSGSWSVCSPQTVSGFSGVGYFFARKLHQELKVPVGMINASWGGTICEAWTSRPALETDPDFKPILDRAAKFQPNQPNQASVLFNGMINPLVPYGIRGAIWYQGESNVGRAAQYAKLFPVMIRDWRQRFGQGDFPFGFVQLAPFRYGNHDPQLLAELWDSQVKTLSVPNTGMAVTTDITDIKDIHPRNKQDVGKRLAIWALARVYDQQGVAYSGPQYDSMTVEGSKACLKFKHVGGGLVAKDGKPLSHFTIAGEDRVFHPATATIVGDTVIVECPMVAKPVAVRFAWTDTAEPNFFNAAGLPASPFRTDNFPLLTADRK